MPDPLKILMLEEEAADAQQIQDLLQKGHPDFQFFVAHDKLTYQKAINEIHPQLIIADDSGLNFSAVDALETIRRQCGDIPFILITTNDSEEFAVNMIKLGADDYIRKDRLTRLPAAVDLALKQRSMQLEKQAADDFRTESEDKYRTFLERISDAIIALDNNWRYTYINKQAGELIHRNPADMIGKNVWDEFPDAVGSATYVSFFKAMQEQQYVCSVDYYPPLDLWQENHLYPSPDGLSVFIRNITERKRAEKLLQESNAELHDLTSRLQDIREEERAAMAREVHDELGQQLTSLKMDISMIARKTGISGQESYVIAKLSETLALVDNAIQSVRKIASDLRPPVLDDLGLIAALEWLTEEFARRSGITTNFTTAEEFLDLSPKVAIGLFRICQESLTNVARHAAASRVTIELAVENNMLSLNISDDGKGFVKDEKSRKTLGLLGMKERANVMGAAFSIDSVPGKGTTTHVELQL